MDKHLEVLLLVQTVVGSFTYKRACLDGQAFFEFLLLVQNVVGYFTYQSACLDGQACRLSAPSADGGMIFPLSEGLPRWMSV